MSIGNDTKKMMLQWPPKNIIIQCIVQNGNYIMQVQKQLKNKWYWYWKILLECFCWTKILKISHLASSHIEYLFFSDSGDTRIEFKKSLGAWICFAHWGSCGYQCYLWHSIVHKRSWMGKVSGTISLKKLEWNAALQRADWSPFRNRKVGLVSQRS